MTGLLYKDYIGIKGRRIAGALLALTALFAVLRLAVTGEAAETADALLFFQSLEVDAVLAHELGYILFLLSRIPVKDEVVEVGVGVVDGVAGVVGNAFGAEQFPVRIIDGDNTLGDIYTAALAVDDGFGFGGSRGRPFIVGLGIGMSLWLRRVAFIHLDGAVPVGVGKEARDVAEVHDMEMCLALFHTEACSTSDDLLKLGHGVDNLVEDDELDHLAVDTSGEELAGGGDDGICCRDGSEIVEFAFTILVAAGDAYNVVGIFSTHVGIFVD